MRGKSVAEPHIDHTSFYPSDGLRREDDEILGILNAEGRVLNH